MFPKKINPEAINAKKKASEERRYFNMSIRPTNFHRNRLLELAGRANAKIASSISHAKSNDDMHTTVGHDSKTIAGKPCPEVVAEREIGQEKDNAPISQVPPKYEWSRLDAFAKHMLEKELARDREERAEIHRKVKADLDRQMDDINKRKHAERMDDIVFSHQQAGEYEKWKNEEKRKEDARLQKEEHEKVERDEQLRYEAERKKEKERRQHEEDRRQAEAIERAIANAKEESVIKKQKERLITKQLMEENERDRLIKLELKKRSASDELRQLREYHELLEKQEAERQQELTRRVERQKMLIKRMEEGVLKTIQAKSNDDNIRALKQQAEMDARAIEVERFKQDRIAQLKEEMKDALQKQIAHKDARRKEEEELQNIHSRILRLDTELFNKSETDKQLSRQERLRKYKEELRQQIEQVHRSRKSRLDALSNQELLMNRELMELVEATLQEPRDLNTQQIC
jgi:hypothetical protein